ncbi:hypothetical protein BCR39DRAFT_553244 [Naematelia encephala]|uniref:Uncharacterized protein n=1 Tax=Naematelia encephala TaxID=71784 RepID=A0A1Y2AGG9_9TREE|nr:hypothetical protein BCR39DRAFT_553244 [Naematelia encephala]
MSASSRRLPQTVEERMEGFRNLSVNSKRRLSPIREYNPGEPDTSAVNVWYWHTCVIDLVQNALDLNCEHLQREYGAGKRVGSVDPLYVTVPCSLWNDPPAMYELYVDRILEIVRKKSMVPQTREEIHARTNTFRLLEPTFSGSLHFGVLEGEGGRQEVLEEERRRKEILDETRRQEVLEEKRRQESLEEERRIQEALEEEKRRHKIADEKEHGRRNQDPGTGHFKPASMMSMVGNVSEDWGSLGGEMGDIGYDGGGDEGYREEAPDDGIGLGAEDDAPTPRPKRTRRFSQSPPSPSISPKSPPLTNVQGGDRSRTQTQLGPPTFTTSLASSSFTQMVKTDEKCERCLIKSIDCMWKVGRNGRRQAGGVCIGCQGDTEGCVSLLGGVIGSVYQQLNELDVSDWGFEEEKDQVIEYLTMFIALNRDM